MAFLGAAEYHSPELAKYTLCPATFSNRGVDLVVDQDTSSRDALDHKLHGPRRSTPGRTLFMALWFMYM